MSPLNEEEARLVAHTWRHVLAKDKRTHGIRFFQL